MGEEGWWGIGGKKVYSFEMVNLVILLWQETDKFVQN